MLVAKEMAPSIILIDEAEKVFVGGKKKKIGLGVTIKKTLLEAKKKRDNYFEKKDRVAVICCSSKPQECNVKECKTFFDKKIYFPYPN